MKTNSLNNTWSIVALLLAFSSTLLGADWIAAEEATAKSPQSALILVQNPKQIPVVLKTCEQLLTDPSYNCQQAQVLVCGPAVHAIVADSENSEVIAHALRLGVKVDACGISLDKLKVSPDQLAPGVSHVKNALITAFQLKSDGWISIDL